jgi:hypothetical protein
MVFATTSNPNLLLEMGMLEIFTATLKVPALQAGTEMQLVLQTVGIFSDAEIQEIAKHIVYPMPIKKLLALADTAKHGEGGTIGERFLQLIDDYVGSHL